MTEKIDAKKKKAAVADTAVHTIREGSVAASIWRRQSPSGYAYYDFSLTRSWESLSSGNTGHSKNFFSRNKEELTKVIELATHWIAQREQHNSPASRKQREEFAVTDGTAHN